jgi:aspartyl/glutamyl-tRNA(Asn/Gln) amidotransferase C subunit
MAVSTDEVLRLAALARLPLTMEEADALRADLESVLRHVEALPPAEAGPQAPLAGLEAARLRPDLGPPDMLLLPPDAIAPAWSDGFYVVPRLASHASSVVTGDASGTATRGEEAGA